MARTNTGPTRSRSAVGIIEPGAGKEGYKNLKSTPSNAALNASSPHNLEMLRKAGSESAEEGTTALRAASKPDDQDTPERRGMRQKGIDLTPEDRTQRIGNKHTATPTTDTFTRRR